MTRQVRRRAPMAVLCCLGVLLAVGAFSSPVAMSRVGSSVWNLGQLGQLGGSMPSQVIGQDLPQLVALPQLTLTAARAAVSPIAALGGPVTWLVMVAGLVRGVMAASGPRTLSPCVGASQHGTRAPPSWSRQVG